MFFTLLLLTQCPISWVNFTEVDLFPYLHACLVILARTSASKRLYLPRFRRSLDCTWSTFRFAADVLVHGSSQLGSKGDDCFPFCNQLYREDAIFHFTDNVAHYCACVIINILATINVRERYRIANFANINGKLILRVLQ